MKTFDEYFHECIESKTIPADTPPYLKKALEQKLWKSTNKESLKRNQLLKILLKNTLLMESQELCLFNISKVKPARLKTFYEVIAILKFGWY